MAQDFSWLRNKKRLAVKALVCAALAMYGVAVLLGFVEPVFQGKSSRTFLSQTIPFWPLHTFLFTALTCLFIYYFFYGERLIAKIEQQRKGNGKKHQIEAKRNAWNQTAQEVKKKDPLVNIKIVSKFQANRLIEEMAKHDQKGVQIESLLTILASLAGFSCQMAIREGMIKTGKLPEKEAFIVVGCADGKKYFTGDTLNYPLVGAELSVYSLVGGIVQELGGTQFPDFNEIFGYVAGTLGHDNFGIPRVPEGSHAAGDLPINYVKDFWPVYLPILKKECDMPQQWPVFFSLALQHVITMAKDTINPETAFTIVMETAIPMSKIDPESL